jgi:ABC-type glycerol-3-phosphate transport system permease component
VVQAIQAAGVFCASVLVGIDTASGKSYHVNSGIALTIIGVLTAVVLGYVAYGLARARKWSRTPALITQILTGLISVYVVQSRQYDWGVPGVALAVAGLILILIPPSVRALAHHAEPAARAQPRS